MKYLQRIDAALEPFGGRFVIHGGPIDLLEGHWSGDLVMIGFNDHETARAWYTSPACQSILKLRTLHAEGDTFIQGASADHEAGDVVAKLVT